MGKIYFRYGTVNSSKSMNLIATAHNYKSQGKSTVVLKPIVDTKSSKGMIESRAGVSIPCIDIDNEFNIAEYIGFSKVRKQDDIYCVIIDEVQFLTVNQVQELQVIADVFDIPVICYGLLTDFSGNMFPSIERLISIADKIEEIKTVCSKHYCNKKAIYNERFIKGVPVFDGESIVVGDIKEDENGLSYRPVCREHYMLDKQKYESVIK